MCEALAATPGLREGLDAMSLESKNSCNDSGIGSVGKHTETSPLVTGTSTGNKSARSDLLTKSFAVVVVSALYILFSVQLIAVNKHLMREDTFPYPIHLVLWHALFSSAVACAAFIIRPSLFPSLTSPVSRIELDMELLLRNALPIAILFSLELVLGNWAYMYSSVPFLQMMKESNLVIIYMLSLVVGLEIFAKGKALVLLCVVFATSMSIEGEIHFSWLGFEVQGSSQVFGCVKMTLQTLLLTRVGKKLDTFAYVLVIMPLVVVVLGTLALVQANVWPGMTTSGTPSLAEVLANRQQLLASATLALCLNISIAALLQLASAVGFILVGIVKDGCIVVGAAVILHEVISDQQVVGFILQTVFILLYSLMNIFPDEFETVRSFFCDMGTSAWKKPLDEGVVDFKFAPETSMTAKCV